jgi:hypothetical protein
VCVIVCVSYVCVCVYKYACVYVCCVCDITITHHPSPSPTIHHPSLITITYHPSPITHHPSSSPITVLHPTSPITHATTQQHTELEEEEEEQKRECFSDNEFYPPSSDDESENDLEYDRLEEMADLQSFVLASEEIDSDNEEIYPDNDSGESSDAPAAEESISQSRRKGAWALDKRSKTPRNVQRQWRRESVRAYKDAAVALLDAPQSPDARAARDTAFLAMPSLTAERMDATLFVALRTHTQAESNNEAVQAAIRETEATAKGPFVGALAARGFDKRVLAEAVDGGDNYVRQAKHQDKKRRAKGLATVPQEMKQDTRSRKTLRVDADYQLVLRKWVLGLTYQSSGAKTAVRLIDKTNQEIKNKLFASAGILLRLVATVKRQRDSTISFAGRVGLKKDRRSALIKNIHRFEAEAREPGWSAEGEYDARMAYQLLQHRIQAESQFFRKAGLTAILSLRAAKVNCEERERAEPEAVAGLKEEQRERNKAWREGVRASGKREVDAPQEDNVEFNPSDFCSTARASTPAWATLMKILGTTNANHRECPERIKFR